MLSSPGGFPYDGLYKEVPLERGTFFTLIKAYERVGTCDFSNCKKTQKAAKKCVLWLWKIWGDVVVLCFIHIQDSTVNPLSPKSDQRQISPCNITAL